MTTPQDPRHALQAALQRFGQGSLAANGRNLLATLGYNSDRQLDIEASAPQAFLALFGNGRFQPQKALLSQWRTVDLLCQLTGDEIRPPDQPYLFDSAGRVVDQSVIESYLFIAIDLTGDHYSRTQLAQITRELNKLFPMPAMLLFRHGPALTLSIINRRLHKRDSSQDVLEKVTLIKDIRFANPHRAHLEILFDLSLAELLRVHRFHNFVELHQAWQKTLDSSELNKRFFKEIANWYFWAVKQVTFPAAAGPDETRNATSVIRLITRLIFVWFLKEKGLVADELFHKPALDRLLTWDDPQGSTYYKAILQNLFFATLNQEMNTPHKPDKRKFRGRRDGGSDQHFMVHNVYRYERYFRDPAQALPLFANVPFLNGGLFECLDRRSDGRDARVDGFSDRPDNPLHVPDELFFGAERPVDLNDIYGTAGKRYSARPLIETLHRYKFTITENTPLEEEIALDPELLGQVFENLLAAYNPETGTTARKQTGSFYTPREIVDYMVDESLLAYLETKLGNDNDPSGFPQPEGSGRPPAYNEEPPFIIHNSSFIISSLRRPPAYNEEPPFIIHNSSFIISSLRRLLAYNEEPHPFTEAEVEKLIEAIDHANILDPACGSGAFPMGILHKLVYLLGKLDPRNVRWKERQIAPIRRAIADAKAIPDSKVREQVMNDLEQKIVEIEEAFARNELDYGRKLFLIENCIYGVDIQPIAVQIARLRFFISLVVDQRSDDAAPNRGILPLPNLETKFVAANTLLGIDKPQQMGLRNPAISEKEKELADARSRHFGARSLRTKEKYRQLDKELRAEISALLKQDGFPNETTQKLAHWDPYNQNASAGFFDPEWMFGLTDGFDVVIGNPPYVRQEKIKELKPALQQQYDCYTGIADLYVYFYEAGYRLLREKGVLTYISSNKYFRAGYGQKLRHFLGTRAAIRHLIDFGDAPVFTAIAYPSIISLQKMTPAGNHVQAFTWQPGPPITDFAALFAANRFSLPQQSLAEDGWRLEDSAARQLLQKLRAAGKPLGEYVQGRFYYGIKTGLNEAFVVDRPTRDRLIAEHPSSAEVLKPFLRGRDVKRWQVNFAEQHLIKIESSVNRQHPWSGKLAQEAEKIFARTYPAIYNHFKPYREKLIQRYDQGQYFWELRACAYWQEFEEWKIVWGNLATQPKFTFAGKGYYINAPANLIVSSGKYLLGILNSQITQYLVAQSAAARQGGFLEYKPMYVTEIPIAETKNKRPIEALVVSVQIVVAELVNPQW